MKVKVWSSIALLSMCLVTTAFAKDTKKPVLLWSYTRPAAVCVDLLSEAGLPLFTNVHNCACAMRAMADYRTARGA